MATVTIRPNGDGTHDGNWTLTGGTAGQAYTTVDEAVADDADYVSNNDTSSPYQMQTVTLEDMPAASAISSVVMKWRTRCASSTTTMVPVYRSGGADNEGSAVSINTTDTEKSWDITAEETWTDTLINALEIGWRRNAAASNIVRVSQAWVEITYTANVTFTRDVPVTAVLVKTASRSVPSTAALLKSLSRSVPTTGVIARTAIMRPANRNLQIGYFWLNELDENVELYASVDEASVDDADYIVNNRQQPYEERTGWGFEMLPDATGHNPTIISATLHYRAKAAVSGARLMPFVASSFSEITDMDAPGSGTELTDTLANYSWDFTGFHVVDKPWNWHRLNYHFQAGFYKDDQTDNAVTISQVWIEVAYYEGDTPFRPVPVNAHIGYQIIPETTLTNDSIAPDVGVILPANEYYAQAIYEVTITAAEFDTVDPLLTVTIYRVDGSDHLPESSGSADGVTTFALGFLRGSPSDLDSSSIGVVAEGAVTFSVTCWLAAYVQSDFGV